MLTKFNLYRKLFASECSLTRLAKTEKAEFTGVNEHFSGKRNEVSGHYEQIITNKKLKL